MRQFGDLKSFEYDGFMTCVFVSKRMWSTCVQEKHHFPFHFYHWFESVELHITGFIHDLSAFFGKALEFTKSCFCWSPSRMENVSWKRSCRTLWRMRASPYKLWKENLKRTLSRMGARCLKLIRIPHTRLFYVKSFVFFDHSRIGFYYFKEIQRDQSNSSEN